MQLSGGWNNYHKLIGRVKFSLFNKPIKKFKFTNEFKFGNSIRENDIHMYYIGNFNYGAISSERKPELDEKGQTCFMKINERTDEWDDYSKEWSEPQNTLGKVNTEFHDGGQGMGVSGKW